MRIKAHYFFSLNEIKRSQLPAHRFQVIPHEHQVIPHGRQVEPMVPQVAARATGRF